MKTTHPMVILAALLTMASCSQPTYYGRTGINGPSQMEPAKPRQYLALPGQSTVQVGTEDADEAFDRQVAAYNTPEQNVQSVQDVQQPAVEDIAEDPGYTVQQPVNQPQTPARNYAPGTADYAVQITNGTTGRLYVEAQDAAGHIFPCGPMFSGQSISSQPDPVGPLKGPITVVIRDPDKPGAPEIRRYKVDPPAVYSGKTVGITILPGGQYRADTDGNVYYTSPAPNAAGGAN